MFDRLYASPAPFWVDRAIEDRTYHVRFLSDRGGIYAVGYPAPTPLQHAILQRQPAAVRLLLDRGADLNLGAGPGSLSPLFLAAGDTDPAILKLLLAHGADPTVEDENGVTPLSRAVSAGTLHGPDRPMFGGCRVETVRALLAHDPKLLSKRNAAWNDAVWWARFQRCEEVLKLIGE